VRADSCDVLPMTTAVKVSEKRNSAGKIHKLPTRSVLSLDRLKLIQSLRIGGRNEPISRQ